MSDLRVLTDAELDLVSGGLTSIARPRNPEPIVIKLVEEILVDILRILEPKQHDCKIPAPRNCILLLRQGRWPMVRRLCCLTISRGSDLDDVHRLVVQSFR